jgi:hypothetical protein
VLPQAGAGPKPQEASLASETAAEAEAKKERTPRVDGAGLLKRTFEQDVYACCRCGGRRRVLAYLTIVSHPMVHRVGDRLLLDTLAADRPIHLSRSAPDFRSPGKALDMPLADPFLSRKPLTFSVGPEGHLRLRGPPGLQRCAVSFVTILAARIQTLA